MKPDNIRDIIACTALYRPGPLEGGMVDGYIECKHGRRTPNYPHPVMEEVLGETYGVMVYQESIMRILNRLGGIELSSAYACIKAISKKKGDIIDARRIDFLRGAQEKGLSKEKAEEIFKLIVLFGGYGFNKSHSAAYAQVTYQTAYLKQYYPAEFMAALLSSEIDDGNKRDMLVDHIADARKLGVPVLPPDVNQGQADFGVVEGKIVFGLTAIKGLGRGAAEEIVRVRTAEGPFKDLFEFCERVDSRAVTRAAIEKMIKAGAMDSLGRFRRAAMFHALPRAIAAAEEKAADRRRGQKSIFDMFGGDDDSDAGEAGLLARHESLPEMPEWSELERLKHEKEALDFYISSHPLAQFDEQLRRFRTHGAAECAKASLTSEIRIGGMVTEIIPKMVAKGRNAGNRWAIVRVEDFTGSIKCILWSETFARFKDEVKLDDILLFEGKVEWREGSTEPDLIVSNVTSLEQAKRELCNGVVLRLPYTDDPDVPRKFQAVAGVLKRSRGSVPVYLAVHDPNGRIATYRLGSDYTIDPHQLRVEEVEMLLGPGSVLFTAR
jgi:DNA polymerase-3 subunit alpha